MTPATPPGPAPAGPSRARTLANVVLIALFVAAAWLPLAGLVLGLGTAPTGENRRMAALPTFRLHHEDLDKFPGKFEDFYRDHFGFRGTLLRWLSLVQVGLFDVSPSTRVVVGKDGWLYCVNRPVGDDINVLRPFTPEELAAWARTLECRRDWLARRGIRYLFIVAPDKQTVYPEFLPKTLRDRRPFSRLDQLLAYLRSHAAVSVLDLRPALCRAKKRQRVYHTTDTHWNALGAFVAYRQLARILAAWYPAVRPLPRAAFALLAADSRGGDLARMVNLDDRLREEFLNLLPCFPPQAHRALLDGITVALTGLQWPPFATERPGRKLPRVVVFHDSFFLNFFHAFLSESCRRAVYVARDDFDPALVEREHPDLVIQELVERKLEVLRPCATEFPGE